MTQQAKQNGISVQILLEEKKNQMVGTTYRPFQSIYGVLLLKKFYVISVHCHFFADTQEMYTLRMKTGCCDFAVDLEISTGVDVNISLLLENDCNSGNFFGFYVYRIELPTI